MQATKNESVIIDPLKLNIYFISTDLKIFQEANFLKKSFNWGFNEISRITYGNQQTFLDFLSLLLNSQDFFRNFKISFIISKKDYSIFTEILSKFDDVLLFKLDVNIISVDRDYKLSIYSCDDFSFSASPKDCNLDLFELIYGPEVINKEYINLFARNEFSPLVWSFLAPQSAFWKCYGDAICSWMDHNDSKSLDIDPFLALLKEKMLDKKITPPNIRGLFPFIDISGVESRWLYIFKTKFPNIFSSNEAAYFGLSDGNLLKEQSFRKFLSLAPDPISVEVGRSASGKGYISAQFSERYRNIHFDTIVISSSLDQSIIFKNLCHSEFISLLDNFEFNSTSNKSTWIFDSNLNEIFIRLIDSSLSIKKVVLSILIKALR